MNKIWEDDSLKVLGQLGPEIQTMEGLVANTGVEVSREGKFWEQQVYKKKDVDIKVNFSISESTLSQMITLLLSSIGATKLILSSSVNQVFQLIPSQVVRIQCLSST